MSDQHLISYLQSTDDVYIYSFKILWQKHYSQQSHRSHSLVYFWLHICVKTDQKKLHIYGYAVLFCQFNKEWAGHTIDVICYHDYCMSFVYFSILYEVHEPNQKKGPCKTCQWTIYSMWSKSLVSQFSLQVWTNKNINKIHTNHIIILCPRVCWN